MNNTTSLQSSVKHKSGLDVLTKYRGAVMGIAALWILFFHEWQLLSTEPGKLADFENYIKRIGFCGVDIFLFLSGIGLVFAIGKKSILSFYYRRLKRVYLPFLIVGIIRAVTEKWTSEGFRDNVLCISFYKTNMYSFLWFVPAILTLYLLFPLYYKIFSKSSNKLMFTAAMFVIWMALSLFFRDKLRPDLYGFTNRSFIVPTSNCSLPNLLIAISFPFVTAKLLEFLCNIPKVGIIGKGLVKFLSFFGLFSLELYCVQEWLSGKLLAEIGDQTPMMKNIAIFALCTIAGFILYLAVKYFWIIAEFIAKLLKALIKKKSVTNK